jgi:pyruvate kinase
VLLPETSIGKYFEESVKMLSHICREAESQFLAEKANQRYLEHQSLMKSNLQKRESSISANSPLDSNTIASCAVKASYDLDA